MDFFQHHVQVLLRLFAEALAALRRQFWRAVKGVVAHLMGWAAARSARKLVGCASLLLKVVAVRLWTPLQQRLLPSRIVKFFKVVGWRLTGAASEPAHLVVA